MSAPKVTNTTVVVFMPQISFTYGPEWGPWEDVDNEEGDEDINDTIGKVELFHHFMEHGRYPEPFANPPEGSPLDIVQKVRHAATVMASKREGYKVRTRIVKRTIVATITEEEADRPMIVQHGKKA